MIVIDVLRMTTTATLLAERGIAALEVMADLEPARARARATGSLLLGERHARPLPDFDGGNSPLEYVGRELDGRRALLCTSNGSRAVEAFAHARHVLLGTVRNAAAVAARALDLAEASVTLACAGTDGLASLDDVLGAACIAEDLLALDPSLVPCDGTRIALTLLEGDASLEERLRRAAHARTLVARGFEEDLRFAARRDASDAVLERVSGAVASFRDSSGSRARLRAEATGAG